jgi:hypothetical protein
MYLISFIGLTATNNKVLSGASYGLTTLGDAGTLSGNVANGNAVDGIDLSNPGTGVKPALTASNNRAAFNTGYGFDSTPGGAVDGGGNVVQANGNAAQCANIVCHEVDN